MSTETHSAEPAADDATRDSTRTDDAVSASPRTGDVDTRARVTLLEAENRRLREEYARAKRSSYRKTAFALVVVGCVAVGGGILFEPVREVLIVLGATGLFGGILTYYLTPGQFVAADIGERIYSTYARNASAIATELGVQDDRLYVPVEGERVQLYLPAHTSNDQDVPRDVPTPLSMPFVLEEQRRGVTFTPNGLLLLEEFERGLRGDLGSHPQTIATQLSDGVVEQLELASSADPDVDAADGRVTVAISGAAITSLDRFDHPIPSFLATGFAAGLERPVRVEVRAGGERSDWLVTLRFRSE
ncbi:hypothetical protein [Natrialba sp. INN-245]|uniref:hypothetical protein n=1 Tax=Natrialba sp. INN-245 TaxID=2690967 RepID=UPI001310C523|nr:hypothetical protein [Natrialba sp. INN-245]MWV41016.1 hypothetical protein [Natrialba sp. INN-245]